MRHLSLLLLLLAALSACGGSTEPAAPVGSLFGSGPGGLEFPLDEPRPGESLDANGFVVPADSNWQSDIARSGSAINADSEFVAGSDRFSAVGNVSDIDAGAKLVSALAGLDLAAAVYRLPLAGQQPGVASADVNLHLRSDGTPSSYWLAAADFSALRWDIFGPFSDSHVRVALSESADYTSPLGNCFVAVIAHSGAVVDVVGVAATARNGDAVAPPVPAAFAATPVAGGLLLEWSDVIAADLAGYRVHYSYSPFAAPSENGVQTTGYLEGLTRHLLLSTQGTRLIYVAVSSVDIDGNASALSNIASASPLPGAPPQLEVTTSILSGETGAVAVLTASGAQSYDFDLDGDGNYEVTGDVSGNGVIDTSSAGIIRAGVRGTGSSGSAVALGSVSLLISGNPAPIAVLSASDIALVLGETGSASVNFDGAASYDPDGGALTYALDPQGDGSYINLGAVSTASAAYSNTGVYLAKLRVTDADGKTGYDSVAITVRRFASTRLDTSSGVSASVAVIAGRPAVAWYDFDRLMYIRATDAEGRQWAPPEVADDTANKIGRYASLVEVAGLPAISYYDETTQDLYYVLAVDALGGTWNPPVLVDSGGNVGEDCVMLVVNGTPAIAYRDDTNDRLKFARSSSVNGYPAATWSDANVSFNTGLGVNLSMAIISGNPAISYLNTTSGNRLGYVRADSVDGSSWGFPIIINDPVNSDQDGTSNSLAEVAGHPAIAFKTFDGADGDVFYVRSTTTTGENASDWPSYVPAAANSEDYGVSVNLAIVGGRPAVVFYDGTNDAIRYLRATTVSGGTAAAWPASVVVDSYEIGLGCDLAEVNGLPVVAFYSGDLDFAVPELQ